MNRDRDPVMVDLNRYLMTQEDDYVDPLEAEIQYQEYLADQDEGWRDDE
jgi:hypothetical protein|tara:strand:+ start:176 stop:322 length:147 start_codon:yes stop_codon:yes gene_type:complete